MGKNMAMLGAAGIGAYYLKQMMNKVSNPMIWPITII
jgi:hypothetical protein